MREFAERFSAEQPELHVLINNAGTMPPERTHTEEGFELTFATNVLGPFLLTNLLLGSLERGAPSRVVNVSSGGMYTQKLDVEDPQLERREYDPPAFYAHTKRCEVILTELWAERLRGTGVERPLDAPWLGRHAWRSDLAPALSQADAAAASRRPAGRRHAVWLATAPEPANRSGLFWHDREPRPVHRVPWTRESADERQRLWAECARLSGWTDDADPAAVGEARA